MLVMINHTLNDFWKAKQKIGWTIKSNCSTTKNVRKPNILCVKSVNNAKISRKLSTTTRQTKKVFQVNDGDKGFTSYLYKERIKTIINIWRKKF